MIRGQEMLNDRLIPGIHICTLEAARDADVSAYDAVITIEDSAVEDPFRIETSQPPQCVLTFDDILRPSGIYILPEEQHVRSALSFAREWGYPSLLVHCHAGMSRSPAIALAILLDWLGEDREEEAVRELLKIQRLCTPNWLVVKIADRLLGSNGQLSDAVDRLLGFHDQVTE